MKVVINEDMPSHVISRHIYGHFAEHLGRCVYEGLWVGEDSPIPNTRGIRNDVVEALRKLAIPNLRWPGGCYADEYHWKDGIGPKNGRRKIVNTHWGGEVESNHFGTHEFMDLCQQLGCEPYICGNIGSGTVREMQDWIEYLTFDEPSPMTDLRRENGREAPWKLEHFGVGNESWGCGGNMRAEYYADEYRRYQTYIRNFSGNKIYKIACGPVNDDFHWTETLMRSAARFMSGLSFHYYVTMPGTTATEFDEEDWFNTFSKAFLMDSLITRHSAIMDRYDPEKKVGLIVDEWGTWYDVEPGTNPAHLYQQNTLRDALVAGVTLNIFNSHCDRVHTANIAQTVNVLQAMVLTDQEKMLLTPSYHVFEMYKVHQDAYLLSTHISANSEELFSNGGQFPLTSVSASRTQTGKIHLSFCNLHPSEPHEVVCEFRGGTEHTRISGRVLTDAEMNAHNTFEQPIRIKPEEFNDMSLNQNVLTLRLLPKSVTVIEIDG